MKTYWLIWFIVMTVSFLIPEVIALCTNVYATLSWTLWDLEGFLPGQDNVLKWSAVHFLIGGLLIVLLLWLIGHLVFGIWT